MEEKLFCIGAAMGVYAWGTRLGSKTGRLDNRWATGLWHGLFCALAGFSMALIAMMSIESRARITPPIGAGTLTLRELYAGVLGGALLGLWGMLRAWQKGTDSEARQHYHNEDLEWAETIFSAVVLASLMMYFVIQAFKIPSGSMRSTLLEGDHLFVNKFIYGVKIPFTGKRVLRFKPVKRGDVVVFRFPSEDPKELHCSSPQYGKDFIKRVIGLSGDEVRIARGRVYINGEPLQPEPYAQYVDLERQPAMPMSISPGEYQKLWADRRLDQSLGDVMRDEFGPVRVPEGQYLAMGDNRDRSCDSRFWGPVPESYIKGRAWVIYWPPSRMGVVR